MRREEAGVGSKQNRVATAFKTGQVMKRKSNLPLWQVNFPTVLPVPLCAFCAERGLERLPVDYLLEPARSARRIPLGDPISSAHPHAIGAGLRDNNIRVSVADRRSHSMRKQECRAHLVGKLLIDHPTAQRIETLRFDQYLAGI